MALSKKLIQELLDLTASQPPWRCPYKQPVPPLTMCQGYHRDGCDQSCDRLRDEGKI